MEYPYDGSRKELLGKDHGLDKGTILSNVSFEDLQKNLALRVLSNVAVIYQPREISRVEGDFRNSIFAFGKLDILGKPGEGVFKEGSIYLKSIRADDFKLEDSPKLFIPYHLILDVVIPEFGAKKPSNGNLYEMVFKGLNLPNSDMSALVTYTFNPLLGYLNASKSASGKPMMLVSSELYVPKKSDEVLKPSYNIDEIVAGTTVLYDKNGKAIKNVA